MPKLDNLAQSIKTLVALPPKASANASSDNGAAVDARSYEQYNAGQVVMHVGAATGSPSSFSIVYTLEHSTDNSTWVTAQKSDSSAGGDATVTAIAAGVYTMAFKPGSLRRFKRVTRAVTITGGTSPTVPNGAEIQFGDARREPV